VSGERHVDMLKLLLSPPLLDALDEHIRQVVAEAVAAAFDGCQEPSFWLDERLAARLRTSADESPWFSLAEAARYVRVSQRTIQRLVERGRIRSMTVGRRRLLHRDDLDALVRAATGEDATPVTPSRRQG
jgi:excisionase family DNA binding protein